MAPDDVAPPARHLLPAPPMPGRNGGTLRQGNPGNRGGLGRERNPVRREADEMLRDVLARVRRLYTGAEGRAPTAYELATIGEFLLKVTRSDVGAGEARPQVFQVAAATEETIRTRLEAEQLAGDAGAGEAIDGDAGEGDARDAGGTRVGGVDVRPADAGGGNPAGRNRG